MKKRGIAKRTLAIILALMLCVTLFPLTVAFAADDITNFSGLQALFESGGSGKLANDIELTENIMPSGSNDVTLDLNGHKLISTAADTSAVIVVKGKASVRYGHNRLPV